MNKLAVLGTGAALLLAAAPAAAVTNFAAFTPGSNQPNIFYTGSMAGNGTLGTLTAQLVHFTFFNLDGTPGGSTFDAWMNLNATTGAAATIGSLAVLPVSNGTVSFTTASAVTWNGHTGTNLLTVSFDGGFLTAGIGGSTANYGVSTPPDTITFTSDFLSFTSSTERDMALAIDAIAPRIGVAFGGQRIHSGSVGGLFGADVSAGNPQGVPEPGSWALMLGGFGLVGFALRSQRRRRVEISFG
jgi:hypothetical protein